MKVTEKKSPDFDEKMKSGLMIEKVGEIGIKADDVNGIVPGVGKRFKTNFNMAGHNYGELDLLIWLNEEEEQSGAFQININDSYPEHERSVILNKLLDYLQDYADQIQYVHITKECEIAPLKVEQLLLRLKEGDVFENILESIPKLSYIDSETFQRHEPISQLINQFEEILFEELVNRKIKVNGKGGVLREVNGTWGRYGFFETGVKKNYVHLSLVQKMGTRTIQSISFQ